MHKKSLGDIVLSVVPFATAALLISPAIMVLLLSGPIWPAIQFGAIQALLAALVLYFGWPAKASPPQI